MSQTSFQFEIISQNTDALRLKILRDGLAMSFGQVIEAWEQKADFRQFYADYLKSSAFPAAYWEHPALTKAYLDKDYEMVWMRADYLDQRSPDAQSFAPHFASDSPVVAFDNLGKNARLVVPCPQAPPEAYKHILSFLKNVSNEQVHELFVLLASELKKAIDVERPLWLNTAGMGVIWLHIRLDSRPKYYKTRAYRNPAFLAQK